MNKFLLDHCDKLIMPNMINCVLMEENIHPEHLPIYDVSTDRKYITITKYMEPVIVTPNKSGSAKIECELECKHTELAISKCLKVATELNLNNKTVNDIDMAISMMLSLDIVPKSLCKPKWLKANELLLISDPEFIGIVPHVKDKIGILIHSINSLTVVTASNKEEEELFADMVKLTMMRSVVTS